MNIFSIILRDLQAAIAAKAARERTMTVLLVALWGRIARMRTRLERLIALWRAGTLPPPPAPRPALARAGAPRAKPEIRFPAAPGWLLRKLGYEVAAYGSQLRHLLTEAECQEFLAAVPRAGRILRPLLRMLTPDPVPEIIRQVTRPVPVAPPALEMLGVVVGPGVRFSRD